MTYWKTQHFKLLQSRWYEHLEESGFKDAEKLVGDEMALRQNAQNFHRGMEDLEMQMRESYFVMLAQRAHETTFDDEVDALIMMWFAEGRPIKEICQELCSKGASRCRNTITFTIRKYEMLWGMKQYTPQQLNKKTKLRKKTS